MCDTEMDKSNCATQTKKRKTRRSLYFQNRKVRDRLLFISLSLSNDSQDDNTVTNDEAAKYLKEVRKYKWTHLYDLEISKITEKLIPQLKLFVKRTRRFGQLIKSKDKIKCHKYNTRPRKVVLYDENDILLDFNKPTTNTTTSATNTDKTINNNLTSTDTCSANRNSLEEKYTEGNVVSSITASKKIKTGGIKKDISQQKFKNDNKGIFEEGKIISTDNKKKLAVTPKFSTLSINEIQFNDPSVPDTIDNNSLRMLTNNQSNSESKCTDQYTIEKRNTNGGILETQGISEQKTGNNNTFVDNNNIVIFNSDGTRVKHFAVNKNRERMTDTNSSVNYPPLQHFHKMTNAGYTNRRGRPKLTNLSLSWINSLEFVREVDEDEYCANMDLPDSFWNSYSLPPNWNDNDFVM